MNYFEVSREYGARQETEYMMRRYMHIETLEGNIQGINGEVQKRDKDGEDEVNKQKYS
jgi:hypothetical protein